MGKKNEKGSSFTFELESSMNNQCRFMTLNRHFEYSESIDSKDDERRKRSFDLDYWNKNMMSSFLKNMKIAIKNRDWELVQKVEKDMINFSNDYFKARKKVQNDEIYFEELDDELRDWFLNYIADCITKFKEESSKIDLSIITENLKKKKVKNKIKLADNLALFEVE